MNIKNIFAVALAISITLSASIMPTAENIENSEQHNGWFSFRGNENNNAVVDFKTPQNADNSVLYWASKIGNGYDSSAIGSPIIVDNNIIFCSGNTLYKMDKNNGEILQSGNMTDTSSYNIVPPTYADGKIFVGLANGVVQAFDYETLNTIWIYKDELGGQPNSPIAYSNGHIYTGFWNTEETDASYICLDTVNGKAEWTYTQKGGFYWDGALIKEDSVIVGTSDGEFGYKNQISKLICFDSSTGAIKDEIDNLNGDICSSITYDTESNRCYFTSKGGSLYSLSLNDNGTFKSNTLQELKLTNYNNEIAMSTSTPVIHNNRAYIGVSGVSQFTQYNGHCIAVVDIENWEIAYKMPTKGYPQVSGLLSTAYEDVDGYSYIYFIDNYTPGQLRVLKDKAGATKADITTTENYLSMGKIESVSGCCPVLFTPCGEQAQYSVCSPIADSDGTIYFKNDSSHLMAVGSKIESIEVTKAPDRIVYAENETFDTKGMKVIARLSNGAEKDITNYISLYSNPLSVSDSDVTIRYAYVKYGDKFNANGGNIVNIQADIPETYVDIKVVSSSEFNSVYEVTNAINLIGEVTLESLENIQTAKLLYEHLDESLKPLVTNVDLLESSENEYNIIKAVYDNINKIGIVSCNSKDLIEDARKSYDLLTENQKNKIINYDLLVKAELRYFEIINTTEPTQATDSTQISTEQQTNIEIMTEKQSIEKEILTIQNYNISNSSEKIVDTGNSQSVIELLIVIILMSLVFLIFLRKRTN